MSEQTPDDRQTHPAADQMRGVSMAVVVDAVVLDSRAPGHGAPEAFEISDGFPRPAPGENVTRRCSLYRAQRLQ